MPAEETRDGLYLLMLSIHGLVRGNDIELGRDADTGGQVSYVVDLARELAAHPDVARVDLMTRMATGPGISSDYAEQVEPLAEGAQIIRIPCGPRRYLHKENLWPYLEEFVRHVQCHVRVVGRNPDLVHGHYADAGYVGSRVAEELGIPFVFTGHSLGRVKKARLLAKGTDEETLERRFKFRRRIAAEEMALRRASLVIASTTQEAQEQYSDYEFARPSRMHIIPPGLDLDRFRPPRRGEPDPPIAAELDRFLRDPYKPMILAVARPDERKNFRGLVQAYGRDPRLREKANLVAVAGTRDTMGRLKPPERRVLQEFLQLVDDFDLYGKVAYPKHHEPTDVPDLYRLAARRLGVFVNPALTEPFGLTLIEAAASGLPIVATHDGGPRDILAQCHNGVLVNPLDPADIARGIADVLEDEQLWRLRAANGIVRAHNLYSWSTHVGKYLDCVAQSLAEDRRLQRARPHLTESNAPLTGVERLVARIVADSGGGNGSPGVRGGERNGERPVPDPAAILPPEHISPALKQRKEIG